jgi:hypothetical protein
MLFNSGSTLRDSDEDVVREDATGRSLRLDSIGGQLGEELGFAEAVLRGMVQEGAIEPSIQRVARYFFEEEKGGGFEDAPDFGYAGLPVRDMMQHPEVEDCVEVFIRKWELLHARYREHNLRVGLACEPLLRAANLTRVEVDSVDLIRTELFEQYLNSDTATAANVECASMIESATEPSQHRAFVASLDEGTDGIVDQQPFRQVQFHTPALVIKKYRTNGVMESSRTMVRPAAWATLSHSSRE